jgi:hypothetical protein
MLQPRVEQQEDGDQEVQAVPGDAVGEGGAIGPADVENDAGHPAAERHAEQGHHHQDVRWCMDPPLVVSPVLSCVSVDPGGGIDATSASIWSSRRKSRRARSISHPPTRRSFADACRPAIGIRDLQIFQEAGREKSAQITSETASIGRKQAIRAV